MDVDETGPIKETLLSQRPRPNSLPVAVLSVTLMLFLTLLQWRRTGAGFAAVAERIFHQGEYWRLVTTIGVHADAGHFLVNASLFFLFSYLLYGYFGFWIYPVLTLALGSLTNYFSLLTYPPNTILVGASGVVYLMAGFWLSAYILIERSLPLGRRLLRTAGVGLIVLVPSSLQEQVSYRTHAIGFGLGVATAFAYFLLRKNAIRSAEVVEENTTCVAEIPPD